MRFPWLVIALLVVSLGGREASAVTTESLSFGQLNLSPPVTSAPATTLALQVLRAGSGGDGGGSATPSLVLAGVSSLAIHTGVTLALGFILHFDWVGFLVLSAAECFAMPAATSLAVWGISQGFGYDPSYGTMYLWSMMVRLLTWGTFMGGADKIGFAGAIVAAAVLSGLLGGAAEMLVALGAVQRREAAARAKDKPVVDVGVPGSGATPPPDGSSGSSMLDRTQPVTPAFAAYADQRDQRGQTATVVFPVSMIAF